MTFPITPMTPDDAARMVATWRTVDAVRNTIVFNGLSKGLIPELAGLDADSATVFALSHEDALAKVQTFRSAYEARQSTLKEERRKAAIEARKNTALRTQALAIKNALLQGMDVNLDAYILSRPDIVPHLVELGVVNTKAA